MRKIFKALLFLVISIGVYGQTKSVTKLPGNAKEYMFLLPKEMMLL